MRTIFKWTGRLLVGLVALFVLALGGVYGVSSARMRATFDVPAFALAVPADSAAVARGRHVATIRGCMDCHGENFTGRVFIDDPLFGRVAASNLTTGRGGVGSQYTDGDWERAIRHGVGADGRGLLVMPSYEYHGLSDEDVAALAAFIKQLPPADNPLPAPRVGPLGRALYLAGKLPLVPAEMIDHAAPRVPPAPGPTAAYGAYLAASCMGCHGHNLGGGPLPAAPPDAPLAANLTPAALGAWSEADFFRALREGVRPDGTALADMMPWRQMTAPMTDDELRALWLYLQSVPPVAGPGTPVKAASAH